MAKAFIGIPQEVRYAAWCATYNQVLSDLMSHTITYDTCGVNYTGQAFTDEEIIRRAKETANAAHGTFELVDL